jgi:regulator of cell morphogenesis and NO signaling
MNATMSKTVRELALENPGATRVFEQMGIDYCCGGQKPLEEACAAANVSVDAVLAKLEELPYSPGSDGGQDWQKEPLARLIAHINGTHHVFVRSESARILRLLDKVCGVHGGNHPELLQVQSGFAALAEELSNHMTKEEQILFPYILAAEQGSAPHSCFGSVQNPIRMMMFEHDNAGNVLRELRRISDDYTAPADACISYRTLYQALLDFEADLHQHIHLENNILFPRAIAMEQ